MTNNSITVKVDRLISDRKLSPAWRWGRAHELLRGRRVPGFTDDLMVHNLWAYLWDMAEADTQDGIAAVRSRNPLLVAAHHIYRDAGETRKQIDMLIILNEGESIIAQRTVTPVQVIRAYVAIFFDQRAPCDRAFRKMRVSERI